MANFSEENFMSYYAMDTEQSLGFITHDTFYSQFPANNFADIFQQSNQINNINCLLVSETEGKKRKPEDVSPESSCTAVSSSTIKTNRNSCVRRKRVKRMNEKAEQNPKEVVHVRARRGQATDSHSLAERVRRGKINERLKCLQDMVPGCYKTMGMAVMLDEIINYVQSLQNQVEFLSMKLTAASTFYDFNSETDAIDTMQRAKAMEATQLERMMKREANGGFGVGCSQSQLTWPF